LESPRSRRWAPKSKEKTRREGGLHGRREKWTLKNYLKKTIRAFEEVKSKVPHRGTNYNILANREKGSRVRLLIEREKGKLSSSTKKGSQ